MQSKHLHMLCSLSIIHFLRVHGRTQNLQSYRSSIKNKTKQKN